MITLCSLTDFNLTQEMTQMAIRDVNGLAVLVNILRTDHINCQVKKGGLPVTGFKVGLLPNRFSLKQGGGGLHEMRYRQGQKNSAI